MSKGLGIILIIVGLLIGLAGGAYGGYKYYPTKNKPVVTETVSETTTATTETTAADSAALETCLKAKWGESKYQAISANPSLASVDDKFIALPCYK